MSHGLLLIALFIAATALTSGEYSSSFMAKSTTLLAKPTTTTTHPKTTTTHPKTTTTHPKTTTTHLTTTTPHANTTTPHANTTTTHLTTTTPHANTTTPHANTTTTHLTTTTPHANTTTPHTNTTTTHLTTTTPHANTTTTPHTTTAHPHTTTPAKPGPTQPTKLTVGNYSVSDEKDNKCILADLGIGIRVNTSKVNDTFIVQPSLTTASGNCGNKTATINLVFKEGNLTLTFNNDVTAKKVYVQYLEFNLAYAFTTGDLEIYSGSNKSVELFAAVQGHSYACSAETVYMGYGVSLDLSNYKLQAFDIKKGEFGTSDLCKADKPDYRVPIAVGIILIILIVIVVIAYLISRKRRSDGYQSL